MVLVTINSFKNPFKTVATISHFRLPLPTCSEPPNGSAIEPERSSKRIRQPGCAALHGCVYIWFSPSAPDIGSYICTQSNVVDNCSIVASLCESIDFLEV